MKNKFVRESKFRHIYGQVTAKDQLFDGFNVTNTSLDGNVITVNRKYIAVVLQSSGGGIFTVLNRDKPGRVDKVFRFVGHTSEIHDITFDRFNPNRIVSGSDDGSFIVWWIPEEGITEDVSEYLCVLKSSTRRVVQSEFHPSAADILIGVNFDSINVFDVSTGECLKSILTFPVGGQLFSFALNFNGTLCAATFKDKKARVYNIMDGELKNEFPIHEGTKALKIAWISRENEEDFLITTGATKNSNRQISVWRIADEPNEPLVCEDMETASAPMCVMYDYDTKLIVTYAKGEITFKFWEFDLDPQPKLCLVSTFPAAISHGAVGFGNKLSCNYTNNEIMHCVRVLPKGIEEVQFVVPRKSETFQADLFPDTSGEEAAITAAEYREGKISNPKMVPVNNYMFPDGTNWAPNKNDKQSPVIRRPTMEKRVCHSTSIAATYSPDNSSDIVELKAEIAALTQRVKKLEEGSDSLN